MKLQIVSAAFIAWAVFGGCLSARTLYVSPVGTNHASGYYPNWAGAATTISAAVARAFGGDTIVVTNRAVYP